MLGLFLLLFFYFFPIVRNRIIMFVTFLFGPVHVYYSWPM